MTSIHAIRKQELKVADISAKSVTPGILTSSTSNKNVSPTKRSATSGGSETEKVIKKTSDKKGLRRL